LTKEEIEKMKAEAKANEASDKAERERVDKLNEADSLIFQTEKQLKEFGDKISADKKAPIETALANLKAAHQAQDVAQVNTALEAMNAAWTAASEEIYKAQAEGAAPGTAPGADAGQANGGASNDTVEDAQFEEVK
jgi:molecular chaperone DnaK